MNAITLLTRDHRAVEKLFTEFPRADPKDRERILVEIIRELSGHAAIEEAHLYPLIANEVDGGDDLVDEAIREHQRVKEILGRLDREVAKAHTKKVAEQVARLEREVGHHVHEEEEEVFPRLESSVTKKRLDEVGKGLAAMKALAPTRPHPNQPPATELSGKVNAVFDRARDVLSAR